MSFRAFAVACCLLGILGVVYGQGAGQASLHSLSVQRPPLIPGNAGECEHHKYLIVGAGPGSLQMAHYLESAGRDYLILEVTRRLPSCSRTIATWT